MTRQDSPCCQNVICATQNASWYLVWPPLSWSLLLIVWAETFTSEACWRAFCRAWAVLNLFPFSQRSRYLLMGWGLSMALSSSPRVTVCLLKSPPCSGDCARRSIKSPSYCTCGCAILEVLDNLCNFCRVKESPHSAGSDNYSSQNPTIWSSIGILAGC